MGKNRDRLSIVAAVIEAAVPGANKTHIMFSAKLSFSLLEKYLKIAQDSGYIRLEHYKYRVTDNGKEFLERYVHFKDRYVKAQKLIEALVSERERLENSSKKQALLESNGSIIE